MSQVDYDSYRRGFTGRRVESVSGLHLLLMFVAAGLLALSRVEHPIVVNLQAAGRQAVQPALEALEDYVRPLRRGAANLARYFTVEAEFRRLERELATLQQLLERTSALAERNEELERLAKLVRSTTVDAVTVEIIAGARGLFSSSVEIGAGVDAGIRYGQPVFSGDGLYGRITAVANRSAKVLPINDVMSRIPVEVGELRRPAIAVGDNGRLLRLVYLDGGQTFNPGDAVVTSGASGEFPRGLRVGALVVEVGELKVRPASKLVAGEFLTVLKYGLPTPAVSPEGDGRSFGGTSGGTVPRSAGRRMSVVKRGVDNKAAADDGEGGAPWVRP